MPVRRVLEHDGALQRLTVENGKGNVFSGDVLRELTRLVREAQANPGLKLIQLAASGRHFSFGASVEEHTADHVADMLPILRELVMVIAASEVPVAAAVQGMCLGGAFEVVLACHFIFVANDARMGVPEIRLGVFPPVAAVLLPRKLGQAAADSLILGGEEWSGGRMHMLGLAQRACPSDSLDQDVDHWFQSTLLKYSAASLRQAVRASRARMLEGLETELKARELQYLDELMELKDANEGIAAFLERRSPQWSNA